MPTLTEPSTRTSFPSSAAFADRHIGPCPEEIRAMLAALGYDSLDALTEEAVPAAIRSSRPLALDPALSEPDALARLRGIAAKNKVWRSYIGCGYHGTVTPPVIQRNVLENPGWYTQYTPYQAEIAQGRLEALLNFQTMVVDLTGLPVANASLLDEATAAAEALSMAFEIRGHERRVFLAAEDSHPQTLAVLRTRARPLGIEVRTFPADRFEPVPEAFGALFQYPGTEGAVRDLSPLCARAREAGALAVVAADPLALALLKPPGECGADIAVGSTQRFGVPLGYGGPHAAYLACRDEHKRQMPGRIVGVSKDARGRPALRLALQTREQHIRRERATSNICTAQVLLAVIASMYAVYHGPEGLTAIARRVRRLALALGRGLGRMGYRLGDGPVFDTVRVPVSGDQRRGILVRAAELKINLRPLPDALGVSLDETAGTRDLQDLLAVFCRKGAPPRAEELIEKAETPLPEPVRRSSPFLTHPVFHRHRSETEMLRYLKRLESRDLSLTHSMIPLGSCTMKLNATAEMLPVTWPEFSALHPFVPADQAEGYRELFKDLEGMLAEITGFPAVSLQPNAGSQGEYAGLLAIRAYHASRGEGGRDVCLIPQSAHGTNPASAKMAGLKIVPVACDAEGNIDVADLKAKAARHAKELAALMVTYPSTHGVFEETIREICAAVHERGGQVYLDGANLNAQVGLCRPAEYGADVCHLNLHKTFCIPHGGGGPGMGPIAVAAHLAPFLPAHPLAPVGGPTGIGAVAAAPWGSPGILTIPWMYVKMMGAEGLRKATQAAILNANYVARKLSDAYPVLYKGRKGLVAHECILDLRRFKDSADVSVEDLAKRLMDYGFHAPTVSWPVAGTVMIEPTESESKEELDAFITAMKAIREEIRDVETGALDRKDNPLRNAPHTAEAATADAWRHPYTRERAVYPVERLKAAKFWPAVGRVDAPYGDRNLVCACPPAEELTG